MKNLSRTLLFSAAASILFSATALQVPSGDKQYSFPVIAHFPPMPVNEQNPVTKKGQQLGRFLFYDPVLSKDSTISCSSCHQQKHAFSDNRRLSQGITRSLQHRNTPPLFNLAWYPRLFWDGRAPGIEEQVLEPVRDHLEMGLSWAEAALRLSRSKFYRKQFAEVFGERPIDSALICRAIAQFERTLISYNARFDRTLRKEARLSMEELEGYELMNDMTKGNCLHCHTTDADGLGTTGDFSNNGLDHFKDASQYPDKGLGKVTGNKSDNGKFKIPSLRNLVFTAPYMHDGRFKTLEEVIDFYSDSVKVCANIDPKMEFAHRGGSALTRSEKRKIVAFLKTLSDSVFITSKEFSNPFSARVSR